MPKLTLNADAEIIEKAKRLADARGVSVSAMFSQFVDSLAREEGKGEERLGPLTRKAIGLVKLPSDRTDRELIEEAMAERFGES